VIVSDYKSIVFVNFVNSSCLKWASDFNPMIIFYFNLSYAFKTSISCLFYTDVTSLFSPFSFISAIELKESMNVIFPSYFDIAFYKLPAAVISSLL